MEVLGGPLFGVSGAGESHGPAITTTVQGCPAGLWVERGQVQRYLDRRRPGGNKLGTPRSESDQVVLLSGLYAEDHDRFLAGPILGVQPAEGGLATATYEAGFTTGEPIAAIVLSAAKRSGDYKQFAGDEGHVRPGHMDLVKHYKSKGFVDVRGGGRSSYRSTISDVVGGSIARLFLAEQFGTAIFSSICQVGSLQADVSLAGRIEQLLGEAEGKQLPSEICIELEAELEGRELHTVDEKFASEAAELIAKTRKEKDSLGAAVEVVAVNIPALVGEPIYQSLKLRLMGSLGGLHAVQACEIGAGSAVAVRRGSENNDRIRKDGYQQNSHGGLLGGISTGMPLVSRVVFKPTSSIPQPQDSVRKDLEEIEFMLHKGRHDPCLGVRAGVTLESRLAIELLNAVLVHQARRVDTNNFELF